ncbi:hypothetical protein GCM10022217_39630 [Chryseobacterium ginsenosidimutans]
MSVDNKIIFQGKYSDLGNQDSADRSVQSSLDDSLQESNLTNFERKIKFTFVIKLNIVDCHNVCG